MTTSVGRASTTRGFIVRLTHRARSRYEYLASADFSVAETSPERSNAWEFSTRASALVAARLALGLRLKDFTYEILPVDAS